ncbi:hypothetical protein ACWDSJ_36265 [Nocardia sp. NPDC003482]
MIVRIVIAACALVAAATGTAAAEPNYQAADKITCFLHVDPPYKTGHGSLAPINFGWKTHCTGRPTLRSITAKLWRYDLTRGEYYLHSERTDTSTEPDLETLYSASCSDRGILYQFHIEVIYSGFYGEWDHADENSDPVALIC